MEIKDNSTILPDKKTFNIIYQKDTVIAGLKDIEEISISAVDEKTALNIFNTQNNSDKLLKPLEINDIQSDNRLTKQDFINAMQMFNGSSNSIEQYREVQKRRKELKRD